MIVLAQGLDGRRALSFRSGLRVRLVDLMAFIGLALVIVAVAGVSISLGATEMGPAEALKVLFGGSSAGDRAFAVWEVRLPRILMGLMVGASIALSGAMLQSMSRNPLADPGLLGLSQGSIVTIMVMIVFLPGLPQGAFPIAALFGGLAVGLMLVLVVGSRSGGMAILLMGIAVETVLSSVTTILILYSPPGSSLALADWMAGSLFRSSWDALATFAPWFALTLPAILFLGRRLRTYDLGDPMAMALGEPVRVSRVLILLTAVVLTSAAVTAVGPLVFLGVMAPHLANFISQAGGRARLVLSAMVGGILVITADTITRTLIGEVALPTGLSLVLVGVPLFVVVLRLHAARRVRRT